MELVRRFDPTERPYRLLFFFDGVDHSMRVNDVPFCFVCPDINFGVYLELVRTEGIHDLLLRHRGAEGDASEGGHRPLLSCD